MSTDTTEDGDIQAEETDADSQVEAGEESGEAPVAGSAPPARARRRRAKVAEESADVESEGEGEEARAYLKGLIEALLFVAEAPMTLKELARAAKIDRKRTEELLGELRADRASSGIQIHEVAGGFCFRSNPEYGNYVRGHLAQRPVRLSRPQLETLAIIAYRQPITRPEIDDIRGVDSGPVLKGLLERDLVKILGKKDEPGRPMLYGTSGGFLELFNMQSLQDLPTLKEFTELSEESRKRFEEQLGEDAPEGPLEFPDAEGAATEGEAQVPAHEDSETEESLREDFADESRPGEDDDSDEHDDSVDNEPLSGPGSETSNLTEPDEDESDETDDSDDDDDNDEDDESDDEDESDDDDDDDSDDDDDDKAAKKAPPAPKPPPKPAKKAPARRRK